MKRALGSIVINRQTTGHMWVKLTNLKIEYDEIVLPGNTEKVAKEHLHVVVVRGEKPILIENLPCRGKVITFEYNQEVKTNGRKFWLEVICPQLANIRDALGLKKQPTFPFHVTIGENKQF
jgi:hypothetical protein